jgi:hypothetical protein
VEAGWPCREGVDEGKVLGGDVVVRQEVVRVGAVEDQDGRPLAPLDCGEQVAQLTESIKLIGGWLKVARQSDGVELSSVKRV